jgi:thymidylate kinase
MEAPTPPRAPLISIEGVRPHRNALVTEKLAAALDGRSKVYIAFEDRSTTLASLIRHHVRGTLNFSDVVIYQLRNANMWENQYEIEQLLKRRYTVITTSHVLTNRANLLSKGLVGPEFCYQLDEGLLKPDFQFYIKGPPVSLEVKPSINDNDTEDSRLKLVESFNLLATQSEEIKVINGWNYNPSLDLSADQTISFCKNTRIPCLGELKYFSGFN